MSDGSVVMAGSSFESDLGAIKRENNLKIVHWTADGAVFDKVFPISSIVRSMAESEIALPVLITVDHTAAPYSGRLYAVWIDGRSSRMQVKVGYSVDGGRTWSVPRVVDWDNDVPGANNPARADSARPNIAVNRQGVVGVSWYDRRGSRDNLGYSVRFSASYDGGDTWTRSVGVSSAPHTVDDPTKPPPLVGTVSNGKLEIRRSVMEVFPGHTTGLTADAEGRFHPVWVDNRTGRNEVWTATVRVAGSGSDPTARRLVGLNNVTRLSHVQIREARYDPLSSTLTFDVGIRNASSKVLRAPMKMRLMGLGTPGGLPHRPRLLTGSGQRSAGESAVIDMSKSLPNGRLLPGQEVWVERVRFRVKAVPLSFLKNNEELETNLQMLSAIPQVFAR
jgi:hypothetical protein